jgi:ribosomal protein S6
MIQATRETNFDAFIETEANRIAAVPSSRIRHLVKFINDLDEAVFYAYPLLENIHPRYTSMPFIQQIVTPDMYEGELNLIPAGYFKYEVYEVSWIATPDISETTAPATETDRLPVADENGVVEGLVAIGKLYLAEKSGSEEVQYTEYDQPASTNTIYYGQ